MTVSKISTSNYSKRIILLIWITILAGSAIVQVVAVYVHNNWIPGNSICTIIVSAKKVSSAASYFYLSFSFVLFCSSCLISYAYFSIYKKVKQTGEKVGIKLGAKHERLKQLKQILVSAILITSTSFVSWTPVIILNIFVALDISYPSTLIEYVIGIFLPINFVANPLLYTLNVPQLRKYLSSRKGSSTHATKWSKPLTK